jgi:hypothetical protein
MAWLGHSTVSAALRYQHVVESRNAGIAVQLDNLILPSDDG